MDKLGGGDDMSNWWHYAATPSGPHAHQIDPTWVAEYMAREMAQDDQLTEDHARAEALGVASEAIRDALEFPVNGRWVSRPGWDSSLAPGEPHPNYLQACRDAGHEPAGWPT